MIGEIAGGIVLGGLLLILLIGFFNTINGDKNMKALTVVNVEKAIKQFQMNKNINLDCSDWDLAEYIWKYIGDKE